MFCGFLLPPSFVQSAPRRPMALEALPRKRWEYAVRRQLWFDVRGRARMT